MSTKSGEKGVEIMDAQKIGSKLKKLRGSTPIEELAKSLGVSKSAISMWENGERIPRDEIKIKIADYFNKSVESIFFE